MRLNHRLARLLPLALALSLATATPALAGNAAGAQRQGAEILTQIEHGALSPSKLSAGQYENVGEYVMGRALGSTQLHERMNALIDEMMGSGADTAMHTYLGERYLGVNTVPSSRYAPFFGLMGVMMSGYRGSPLAGMMSRYLSGQAAPGYPGAGPGMMGYGYATPGATSSSGAWPTGAIVATAALAALALAGATAVALPRLRKRPHREAPTS
jgi:hypothetical protein